LAWEIIMRHSFIGLLVVGLFLTPLVIADDATDEAIKKDRRQIEGTWRIVALEINGNKAADEDAQKLSVDNGSDGTWSLRSEGNEISKGTTTIDPTQKLKTIDITPTEGDDKGKLFLGIYELGQKTRKLCFAPAGQARPTEFSLMPGSEHILVVFERDLAEAIKIDRKRIEGTWRVVAIEINGDKVEDEVAKKITITIGADGSWNVDVDGNQAVQGTSTIDPIKTLKSIDFTPTTGDDKGKQSLGLYEVSDNELKFYVAPSGQARPTEFSPTVGSQLILLTFERAKAK
jgi:uncharacterized protein (TIGR03067 family)